MLHLIARAIRTCGRLVFLVVLGSGCSDGNRALGVQPVASVTVDPALDSLAVGQTMRLTATARDSNGDVVSNVPVNWSTSDANVATVSSSGTVLAAGLGTASIQAESDGAAGTATIVVDATSGGGHVITFATFLGGNRDEQVRDVAIDAQGNVYAVGGTTSTGFPTTASAFQRNRSPGPAESSAVDLYDVFVAKFDPVGNLVWSTLIGGPNYDRAYGVEVDAQGFVYVAGRAGAEFPVTSGAFQPSFQGGQEAAFYGNQDGFVCKLRPDGSALVFCSYFGTGDVRIVRDIAVDQNGDIYLASGWSSGNYPASIASQFTNGPRGGDDAVIAKIRGDGTAVIWATYLGGSSHESNQNSLGIDGAGNPYILFTTESAGIATAGAYDGTYAGTQDVFITKLNPSSGVVVWGTYLGGSENESTETHEFAVDRAGNAYVAAPTKSPNFPTTPGAFSRTWDGANNEVFVSKISSDGARLLASTLLGSTGFDRPEGVAVDASGNVYLTGTTTSSDFPLTGDAIQTALRGGRDAFAVILSADFSTLIYSTLIGGNGEDYGRGAAVGPNGEFAIGGETTVGGLPTVNAAQPGYAGGSMDAILVKIGR